MQNVAFTIFKQAMRMVAIVMLRNVFFGIYQSNVYFYYPRNIIMYLLFAWFI